MAVLRADLAGEEDELLGAVAVVVLVDDELETDVPDIAQAHVGDLHRLELGRGDRDPGLAQERRGRRPDPRVLPGPHSTTFFPLLRRLYCSSIQA